MIYLYVCLSIICLSVYLSIRLLVCPSGFVYPCIFPYVCPYICIAYLSINKFFYMPFLSVSLTICLIFDLCIICVFIRLIVSFYVYLSNCLSLYLRTLLPFHISTFVSFYDCIFFNPSHRRNHLSICQLVYMPIRLSICQFVYMAICLYVHVYM